VCSKWFFDQYGQTGPQRLERMLCMKERRSRNQCCSGRNFTQGGAQICIKLRLSPPGQLAGFIQRLRLLIYESNRCCIWIVANDLYPVASTRTRADVNNPDSHPTLLDLL